MRSTTVLGHSAPPAELQGTVGEALALILDPLSTAARADEYRGKVVTSAILRNRCQLDVVCPFVDLKQLQHAEAALQEGYEDLAAGDTKAAARDARRAYLDATLALKKATR